MPVDLAPESPSRVSGAALHRAVLESALDAILVIDHRGCVLEFNRAAERMFGYREHDIVGRSMAELVVPPHLRDAHRKGIDRVMSGGRPRLLNKRVEVMAMRASGEQFPAELTITRLGIGDATVFTGHIRDITDRKAAEVELKSSRTRLVEAGDSARRRIERDLHDGAQQRLVALGLDLRVLKATLERDPGQAARLVDEIIESLGEAIEELRDLARGIHPAVLTERGLAVALPTLTGRVGVPVLLDAVPEERFSPMVEATAYFVVAEALTNTAKYSGAESATVRVERIDDELVVEIRDDGRGGADIDKGSGLRGLADRVAAQDGTLQVTSAPGFGTTVVARLPCGS